MLFLKKRKPVEIVPTAMDIAREELYAAIAQRNLVLANFDNVAPEYFEIANADLTAANMRVDACVKKLKIIEATT